MFPAAPVSTLSLILRMPFFSRADNIQCCENLVAYTVCSHRVQWSLPLKCNWLLAPYHGIFGLSHGCLCQHPYVVCHPIWCHHVVEHLLSDGLFLCVFGKISSSARIFHKICTSLCMPDMLLGDGLCHSCHILGLLGPHCSVVCLCVSKFPVDLQEWLQNVSPLQVHLSACSLLAFPSSSRWNASVGVDAIMSSMILSSNSLSSNSHLRA